MRVRRHRAHSLACDKTSTLPGCPKNASSRHNATVKAPTECKLRAGDCVVVRSPDEVLSTLDDEGALDGVPFCRSCPDRCRERRFASSVP